MQTGAYGNCHDEYRRLHLPERVNGSHHASSRGDSVIHKNDCLPCRLKRRTVAPIEECTLMQRLLTCPVTRSTSCAEMPSARTICSSEYRHIAKRNCAEGGLLLPGNAEFGESKMSSGRCKDWAI